MTANTLFKELTKRGAILDVSREGDRLRVNAPRGILTTDICEALTQQKWALLALVRQRPEGGCYACHGTRYWLSIHQALICGRCHPPANPSLVAEWIEDVKR